jgi:uncharacterized BrkB/YihY/UPF0761 family membrane protein
MKKRKRPWAKYAAQLYVRIQDDDILGLSAQLTFYLLLSLFPFLLFLLNILSLTNVPIHAYTVSITRFLPEDIAMFFRDLVAEMLSVKTAALLSVSALITLWSASRGVQAISHCLNKACDTEENRPFWRVTAITMFFTVCLTVLVMVTLLLLIFAGRNARRAVRHVRLDRSVAGVRRLHQPFLQLYTHLRQSGRGNHTADMAIPQQRCPAAGRRDQCHPRLFPLRNPAGQIRKRRNQMAFQPEETPPIGRAVKSRRS